MPEVCRFNGISIHIYFDDHNPPHFHAVYAEEKAVFRIDTLEKIEGKIGRAQEFLSYSGLTFEEKSYTKRWNKRH